MKFSDIFIFSIVSKRFYQMTRLHKFFLEESEFLNIVSFDEEHFDFLQTELQTFGKNIREKFKEKIIKNLFVFNLLDVLLKKIVYGLLPFKIYCPCFFSRRGSKTARKCDICNNFFIDDNDLGARIVRAFIVTKKRIEKLPIFNLMDQIKRNSILLNLYYVVGGYKKNDLMRTGNFGEISGWNICCLFANLPKGIFSSSQANYRIDYW